MSIPVKSSQLLDLVEALRHAERIAGIPLVILGGSMCETLPPIRVVICNTEGEDWQYYGGTIDGVHIE